MGASALLLGALWLGELLLGALQGGGFPPGRVSADLPSSVADAKTGRSRAAPMLWWGWHG